MFDLGGSKDQITNIDSSTKISTVSDAYNVTTSWSQGLSDIGSTKVTFPGESPIQSLQPVLIIGAAVAALFLLKDHR